MYNPIPCPPLPSPPLPSPPLPPLPPLMLMMLPARAHRIEAQRRALAVELPFEDVGPVLAWVLLSLKPKQMWFERTQTT